MPYRDRRTEQQYGWRPQPGSVRPTVALRSPYNASSPGIVSRSCWCNKSASYWSKPKRGNKTTLQRIPTHHVETAGAVVFESVEVVPVTLDHNVSGGRMPGQVDEPQSSPRLPWPDEEGRVISRTSSIPEMILLVSSGQPPCRRLLASGPRAPAHQSHLAQSA